MDKIRKEWRGKERMGTDNKTGDGGLEERKGMIGRKNREDGVGE